MKAKLEQKDKKIKELEQAQKQKFKQFTDQSKKLTQERDQARTALAEAGGKCNERLEDYKLIVDKVNRNLLENEKLI